MTKGKNSSLFVLFPVFLLILSLLFPTSCTDGVKKGLTLAVNTALPALFPALVLSRMITFSLRGKAEGFAFYLPLILGLLCGFPVGAGTVAEQVSDGTISKEDGEKMLFFCNVASPSFLILLCGKALMGNPLYGWVLFFAQVLFAWLFFLLFFRKKKRKPTDTIPSKPSIPLHRMLGKSLSEAISSFIYISACILFFSFLLSLLSEIFSLSPLTNTLLSLFLELTSGVASLGALPAQIAFPLCAAGVGFGGCCVHLQTLGVIEKGDLNPKFYFLGKFVFSLLLFLTAEIFQKCL